MKHMHNSCESKYIHILEKSVLEALILVLKSNVMNNGIILPNIPPIFTLSNCPQNVIQSF